jgi:uncharacterized protein YgbK (DUF1537 family)
MMYRSTDNDSALPDGPLIAWYGDDFTGAAAVMEVLTFAGLPSMLFLDVPSPTEIAQFPGLRGIGVASTARAKTPHWMDEHLPGVFSELAVLGTPLVHYKVCSTLDSSPATGSIGRAMEHGANQFKPRHIPVLIAAPQLRRYQCFGHLFAGMSDSVYRLDRHPVMARHPVTPMLEADVARHIGKQTDQIALKLMDLEDLAEPGAAFKKFVQNDDVSPDAIVLDGIDASTDSTAGKLIWRNRHRDRFVVGSQGIEYALISYWQAIGALAPQPETQGIGYADRIAVVSGSVSQTTAEQIGWARTHGFKCIAFDVTTVLGSEDELALAVGTTVNAALDALRSGADPLIYTAAGPDDPTVSRFNAALASSDRCKATVNQRMGSSLGKILFQIVNQAGLKRAIISGGDTSGYATQQLDIFALSALAPTVPGAAIFKAHAKGPMDGLELALKGGQMGSPDYFGWVKNGGGSRHESKPA